MTTRAEPSGDETERLIDNYIAAKGKIVRLEFEVENAQELLEEWQARADAAERMLAKIADVAGQYWDDGVRDPGDQLLYIQQLATTALAGNEEMSPAKRALTTYAMLGVMMADEEKPS